MADMVTDEELAEMGYTEEAAVDEAEAKTDAEPVADGGQQTTEPEPDAESAELDPEGEKPAEKDPGELRRENDDDEEEAPKVSRRALKRAKYEIKTLRREIEELKREREAAQKAPEPKAARLRKDQFASEEDYFEALVKTRMAEERQATAKAEADAKAEEDAHQKEVSAWVDKIHANFPTQEERDDYDDALVSAFGDDPAASIGAMAGEYVYQHQNGPKILRYLADHPKVCASLKDGHPFEQAEILKNIVAFVEKKAAPRTERRPVAPVGRIRSGGAAAKTVKSAEDIFEEMAR